MIEWALILLSAHFTMAPLDMASKEACVRAAQSQELKISGYWIWPKCVNRATGEVIYFKKV